jgi:hypothetical protein
MMSVCSNFGGTTVNTSMLVTAAGETLRITLVVACQSNRNLGFASIVFNVLGIQLLAYRS